MSCGRYRGKLCPWKFNRVIKQWYKMSHSWLFSTVCTSCVYAFLCINDVELFVLEMLNRFCDSEHVRRGRVTVALDSLLSPSGDQSMFQGSTVYICLLISCTYSCVWTLKFVSLLVWYIPFPSERCHLSYNVNLGPYQHCRMCSTTVVHTESICIWIVLNSHVVVTRFHLFVVLFGPRPACWPAKLRP